MFLAWLRSARPEAILTGDLEPSQWLQEEGIDVPGQVALVRLNIAEGEDRLAGIREDYTYMGERAMDLLVGLVQRNEIGMPRHGSVLMVRGTWSDGESLPPHVSGLRREPWKPKPVPREVDYLKYALAQWEQWASLNNKPFERPAGSSPAFEPVDLKPHFNRSPRRWYSALPLENLPLGRNEFHGVPFELGDLPDPDAPGFVMLASRRCGMFEKGFQLPSEIDLPLDKRVSEIYFLHSCGWSRPEKFATYTVFFEDGSRQAIQLKPALNWRKDPLALNTDPEANVQDWWPGAIPLDSDDVQPVAILDPLDALRPSAYLYVFRWRLQFAGKRRKIPLAKRLLIQSEPGAETTLAILGITLATMK